MDEFLSHVEVQMLESRVSNLTPSYWRKERDNRPYARIYYVKSGAGFIRPYGREYRLRPGRLYLVPPRGDFAYGCTANLQIWWMHFAATLFGCIDLFDYVPYHVERKPENPAALEKRMLRLLETARSQRAADQIEGTGLLLQLIAPFFNDPPPTMLGELREGRRRLLPVLKHIDENLIFAATDSFRLAEKKIKTSSTSRISDILIPFKNIPDIIRVLENMGENADIQLSKNLISFKARDIYLVSRLIDGVFPDYRQIIPKNFSTEAVLLKQDLINALKISNIFSDKFNQIHMVVDPKGKVFEVQTKNNDVGENNTTVDAALTGEKIEINFNYKYVADCFQSIEADSVSLQLSGVNRPMVIRPVSGDQSFMYLAMPMNR